MPGSCTALVGDYKRVQAIEKCERCAKLKKHKYFGLRNGGNCYSTDTNNYEEIQNPQKSTACDSNGKGGRSAYFVYKRLCKY